MGDVWAIVVAAGSGSRFGDSVPKQFSELGGLRLLDWALSTAGAACDNVVIVLRAAQTPQAFSAAVLRRAHAAGGEATDDAALVEALGATVVVVDGDPDNLKITGPDDLVRAEVLLDRRDA